jgi:hypothetical protein
MTSCVILTDIDQLQNDCIEEKIGNVQLAVTVAGLAARSENVGHKLYVDNLSPSIFDDLPTKTTHCVGLLDQIE